jgi:hypothetical protein
LGLFEDLKENLSSPKFVPYSFIFFEEILDLRNYFFKPSFLINF